MFEGQISRLPITSRETKTGSRENRTLHSVFSPKDQETTSSIPGHGGVVLAVHRERKRDQAAIVTVVKENSGVAVEYGTAMCLREVETRTHKGSSTGQTGF